MESVSQLKALFTNGLSELRAVIATEFINQARQVTSKHSDISGYAVIMYEELPEGILVRCTRASDLASSPDRTSDLYSVDEWRWNDLEYYDEFEQSNRILAAMSSKMREMYDTSSPEIEEELFSFLLQGVNQEVLDGLKQLRDSNIFDQATLFVIWIPDSSDPIILESVGSLNTPDVLVPFKSVNNWL